MQRSCPLVSPVLVTMRPDRLHAILAMLARQRFDDAEWIVGLHGFGVPDLAGADRHALGKAAVLEMPAAWPLGRCLNAAVAEARGRFVAKIDDDDIYGRDYLSEAVAHLRSGKGDIVGKAETFVYLEGSGCVMLRLPGSSHARCDYVAGPTLAFARSLADSHPFAEVAVREDNRFLDDCRRAGRVVYATSRRNFLYVRRAGADTHTSKRSDADFQSSGIVLKRGLFGATAARLLALIDADAGSDAR